MRTKPKLPTPAQIALNKRLRLLCVFFSDLSKSDAALAMREEPGDDHGNYLPPAIVEAIERKIRLDAVESADLMAIRQTPFRWDSNAGHWLWILHRYQNRYAGGARMKRYKCSFAYDVPHYFDFTVEAATQQEAQAKIEQALKDGVFDAHENEAAPCFDSADNTRVFVSEESRDTEPFMEPTLEELLAEHAAAQTNATGSPQCAACAHIAGAGCNHLIRITQDDANEPLDVCDTCWQDFLRIKHWDIRGTVVPAHRFAALKAFVLDVRRLRNDEH